LCWHSRAVSEGRDYSQTPLIPAAPLPRRCRRARAWSSSAWLEQADYAVLSIEGSSYVPISRELIEKFNATYHRVAAGDHAFSRWPS
jgi:hypothetical protein